MLSLNKKNVIRFIETFFKQEQNCPHIYLCISIIIDFYFIVKEYVKVMLKNCF